MLFRRNNIHHSYRLTHPRSLAVLAVLGLLLLHSLPALSQPLNAAHQDEPRARFASQSAAAITSELTSDPFQLDGGSSLTFVSPKVWLPLARRLAVNLSSTHRTFTLLFGDIPAFSSFIRLMEEEAFFASTNAPRWTNAMYYRGQIIIPLPASEPVDETNLSRSLRHEYTHALVHAFSAGRCPGWIDEGLAQWAEGEENPALQPALRKWLKTEPPVPFGLLQGGFTRLQNQMVPAAYAQSLFATNTLINTYGFRALRKYFDELRYGSENPAAFKTAFRQSESGYEKKLGRALLGWASENIQ